MNKKYLFLYLLICLLVISCVSLPEPDNANQTVVVGMINMQHSSDTYKAGIEIYLQEFTGSKIYILRSGSGGLFYSVKIPQGTYKLTKIFCRNSLIITLNTPPRIEIVYGKVNNFGTINSISDKKKYRLHQIFWDNGYDQTRNFFRETYNSSNWNEKEWINIGFQRPNSVGYTPTVASKVQPGQSTQVPVPDTLVQTPTPVAQPVKVVSAQSPAPATQQKVPVSQKFALVIGNGTYKNLSRLANPVNDANDLAAALQSMGFVVDKLIDASQEQMDSAVTRLKNRLSVSANSYGFFFYAGHGVQSNGENFLIPVDANIPGENYLRSRAVSVQVMLNELNDARNELNVMVLDACRDNPFGWARSGSRGLAVLSGQPADSIIVYATSAGSTASDGTSRNGLFTSQLLKNLTIPGLEISEIFRRTGADVRAVSNGQQIPAIYSQFFGTAILKN